MRNRKQYNCPDECVPKCIWTRGNLRPHRCHDADVFSTPADLRAWFARHHETEKELLVRFYKRGSGEPSVTWPESVDEALCVGWIDGVRRSVDARAYTVRFTPRRKGSIWSAVNIARVAALTAEGRMQAAGLAAFALRIENRSGVYAYEQQNTEFADPYLGALQANPAALGFFPTATPLVSKTKSVVGSQREAGGNPTQAVGETGYPISARRAVLATSAGLIELLAPWNKSDKIRFTPQDFPDNQTGFSWV